MIYNYKKFIKIQESIINSDNLIIIKRSLSKEWLNAIDKYKNIVPNSALPTVICNFSGIKNVVGFDIFQEVNKSRKYVVTQNVSEINIPKELIPTTIIDKMKDKGWFNERVYEISKDFKVLDIFFNQSIQVVGLNSKDFPDNTTILNSKQHVDEMYLLKYNKKYCLNKTLEGVFIHELGHVYNNRNRVSSSFNWKEIHNRWNSEVNLGIIENEKEAFSEAFSNYYVESGRDLPDYVKDFIKNLN